MQPILYTQRLKLRPWQDSDAESLFEYAKDPDVGPIAGWPPHTSVENSLEVIRGVLSANETYAICFKNEDKPIGSIGLIYDGCVVKLAKIDDECELGFWIGKPFWGQGLIPEASREILRHAFEDLHMKKVWCGYYEGNEKSKHAQDKIGFVHNRTIEKMLVPLLNTWRKAHASVITLERWKSLSRER